MADTSKFSFDVSPEQFEMLQKDFDFTWSGLKKRAYLKYLDTRNKKQKFSLERHDLLGPELAAAHFVVGMKGAVKLKEKTTWIRADSAGAYSLPRTNVINLFVEGIDLSDTDIIYEGFDNLDLLQEIRFLNLSNCEYLDDFCMPKLQRFKDSLEVLDISGCKLLTENGIACLHHLHKLKMLNIANTPNIRFKEVLTLWVEEMLPGCVVLGVDHDSICQGLDPTDDYIQLSGHFHTNKLLEGLMKSNKTVPELYTETVLQESDNSLENNQTSANIHQLSTDHVDTAQGLKTTSRDKL